jgi:hypothetical protein
VQFELGITLPSCGIRPRASGIFGFRGRQLSATWSAQARLIFASETLRREICSSKVAKIQKFNGFRAVSRGGASPLYAVLPPEICLPQTAKSACLRHAPKTADE